MWTNGGLTRGGDTYFSHLLFFLLLYLNRKDTFLIFEFLNLTKIINLFLVVKLRSIIGTRIWKKYNIIINIIK